MQILVRHTHDAINQLCIYIFCIREYPSQFAANLTFTYSCTTVLYKNLIVVCAWYTQCMDHCNLLCNDWHSCDCGYVHWGVCE